LNRGAKVWPHKVFDHVVARTSCISLILVLVGDRRERFLSPTWAPGKLHCYFTILFEDLGQKHLILEILFVKLALVCRTGPGMYCK
jgi:hypothetical protein